MIAALPTSSANSVVAGSTFAGGAAAGPAGEVFSLHLEAADAAMPPAAAAANGPSPLSSVVAPLAQAFEGVNREAVELSHAAQAAQAAGDQLSPSEMIVLSMRCNEFLFHCELTANIANRSSDGVQQLFKEQG